MNEQCKYFFRVHVRLMDADDPAHLCFDFPNSSTAGIIAEKLYNSADCYQVWIEIVTNEVTTTNSPMWRYDHG